VPELGAPELLIILVIVVLVFGGSRVAELGGSLGKGIKEFKKGMRDDDPPSSVDSGPKSGGEA
jgi:sec-independent protein translocase protein TatA